MAARNQPFSAFRALADPARLRLARLVAASGEVSGRELIDLSGLPSTVVYYHLRTLVEAGVLQVRKEHRKHYYRSSEPSVRRLVASVQSTISRAGSNVA
jgi:DNA-binding transcriptional ArsR family regulator